MLQWLQICKSTNQKCFFLHIAVVIVVVANVKNLNLLEQQPNDNSLFVSLVSGIKNELISFDNTN